MRQHGGGEACTKEAAAAAKAADGSGSGSGSGGTCREREYIYVGNSMAALIGMTLQLQRPELFTKMVLVAPAMMPQGVNVVTRFAVYFANAFGFGHKLLLRLPRYSTRDNGSLGQRVDPCVSGPLGR